MRAWPLLVLVAVAAGCTNAGTDDEPFNPTNVATFVPVTGLTDAPPTASPPPTAAPPPASRGLELRALGAGQQAGLEHPGRLTFTDEGSWAQMWEEIREDDAAPAPEVDFTRESVLLALHGPAPSTCYAIRITGAWLVGGEVRANVTSFTPEEGAACGDAITYPWHAVAVDHARARTVFEEREATGAPAP